MAILARDVVTGPFAEGVEASHQRVLAPRSLLKPLPSQGPAAEGVEARRHQRVLALRLLKPLPSLGPAARAVEGVDASHQRVHKGPSYSAPSSPAHSNHSSPLDASWLSAPARPFPDYAPERLSSTPPARRPSLETKLTTPRPPEHPKCSFTPAARYRAVTRTSTSPSASRASSISTTASFYMGFLQGAEEEEEEAEAEREHSRRSLVSPRRSSLGRTVEAFLRSLSATKNNISSRQQEQACAPSLQERSAPNGSNIPARQESRVKSYFPWDFFG
ncbi:hypothetical protein T484DRAFT_1972307 [Baffinella frigidus]|nr:hypothetical protein T484DRAFT_1972306 [Cryptophyta sp. CCMP2293]KAJ1473755.1 hypothetical protein T484DRAFT_1972307 [Cryptophyta sp. CCMP2293]